MYLKKKELRYNRIYECFYIVAIPFDVNCEVED